MEYKDLDRSETPIQTWKAGLKYEKSQMDFADKLYKFFYGQFDDFNIKRWKYQGEGKVMQQSEVDVSLTFDERVKRISEKFRTNDFGDMYIEIYNNMDPKKFDKTKEGWALRRNLSDLIYYYTPTNIYCIQTKELSKVIEKLMNSSLVRHVINNSFENYPTPSILEFCWKNNNIPLTIVKNYTDKSKSDNISIGICVPWEILKEEGCEVVNIIKDHNSFKII